jgi:hypothetical protein
MYSGYGVCENFVRCGFTFSLDTEEAAIETQILSMMERL